METAKEDVHIWEIFIGGGYGTFEFLGTEAEAEEMRRHKANWEAAIGRKKILREPTKSELNVYFTEGCRSL